MYYGQSLQLALQLVISILLISVLQSSTAIVTEEFAPAESTKHEAGRCAIRGHCGKQSFFGGELPCLDNGLAKEPEPELRTKIVNLCGDKWMDGDVCCLEEQVGTSIYYISYHVDNVSLPIFAIFELFSH